MRRLQQLPGAPCAFGSVAEEYDRFRPSPPPAALDWLLPERVALAIDLAAGTGALSRALLAWADEVIAVEPDARMRAVLARRLPSVRLLAGRAESLPLPDASADAVLVSSAWHWLDTDVAVPEIARVLRPGGWLGILWTGLDREDPRVAALWEVARTLSPHPAGHRERHRPGRCAAAGVGSLRSPRNPPPALHLADQSATPRGPSRHLQLGDHAACRGARAHRDPGPTAHLHQPRPGRTHPHRGPPLVPLLESAEGGAG